MKFITRVTQLLQRRLLVLLRGSFPYYGSKSAHGHINKILKVVAVVPYSSKKSWPFSSMTFKNALSTYSTKIRWETGTQMATHFVHPSKCIDIFICFLIHSPPSPSPPSPISPLHWRHYYILNHFLCSWTDLLYLKSFPLCIPPYIGNIVHTNIWVYTHSQCLSANSAHSAYPHASRISWDFPLFSLNCYVSGLSSFSIL